MMNFSSMPPQRELYGDRAAYTLFPEYYLIKVNQFNDVAKDSLDEWIYFLKNEEIRDYFSAKGIKQAKEQLDILKLPDNERQAYEAYNDDLHYQASMVHSSYGVGKLEGRKEGRKEGREEGRREGRRDGGSAILLHLLNQKFQVVSQAHSLKIKQASEQDILRWTTRALTADKIEDIF